MKMGWFAVTAVAIACLGFGRANATVLTWPATTGPCSTSYLQDCINAAVTYDEVMIGSDDGDSYTPINENLTISTSIYLYPAPGIDAVMTSGHRLSLASTGTQELHVDVRDINFYHSHIEISHLSSSEFTVSLTRLHMWETDADNAIEVYNTGTGPRDFSLIDSTFEFDALAPNRNALRIG